MRLCWCGICWRRTHKDPLNSQSKLCDKNAKASTLDTDSDDSYGIFLVCVLITDAGIKLVNAMLQNGSGL
jgi:hypothetical protein